MKRIKIFILYFFILIAGCATISEQVSTEKFDKISRAYEKVLLRSQFNAAYQFLDPATIKGEIDLNKYENIKVVDYAAGNYVLSADKAEIRQTVEIQYYWSDKFILKTVRDDQLWRYYKERKAWLLQTGLPAFTQ